MMVVLTIDATAPASFLSSFKLAQTSTGASNFPAAAALAKLSQISSPSNLNARAQEVKTWSEVTGLMPKTTQLTSTLSAIQSAGVNIFNASAIHASVALARACLRAVSETLIKPQNPNSVFIPSCVPKYHRCVHVTCRLKVD